MKNATGRVILGLAILVLFAAASSAWSAQTKKEARDNPGRILIDDAPAVPSQAELSHEIISIRTDRSRMLGVDDMGASLSPGLTVGITTYDTQHMLRMCRQVDWRGTQSVHFVWAVQSNYDLGGDRGTAYEAWDATFADLVFKGPDGGTNVHPRLGGGVNYSGYAGLDVGTDGRVVISNHHTQGAGHAPTVWPDFSPLGGFFSPWQDRVPDSLMEYDSDDTSQYIWPVMEWQVIDNDTVCHVIAVEAMTDITNQKMHYFRRVGGYTSGSWDYPPLVIDTVPVITGIVSASRVSQKVAICWAANPDWNWPGSTESANTRQQYINDLYYRMSTDMGQNFGPNVNVTAWDSSVPGWALQGDMSALIDTDNQLHVIYNARETNPIGGGLGVFSHFYGCRLFHWAEGQPIRVIKDANWDPPSDGVWCTGGGWDLMSIGKMQISECDGKLYALFVQFNDIPNGIADDCHNRAFVEQEPMGTANGELYISVSSNDGLNWDVARNLTNSYTAHCDSAPSLGGTLECDADMWPSMSRYGMEVTTGDFSGVPVVDPSGEYSGNYFLDVLYVNDKHPGAVICDAGIWTTNPVKWFRVPCVEPVPNPYLVCNPMHIGDPTWTKPGIQLDTIMRLENVGNAPLHFSATTVVELTPWYSGWLDYSPEITTISESDPNYVDFTVRLNFNGVITSDGVGVSGLLIFTTDSPTSPDTMTVDLIVADTVQWPEYATIHTTCKPLYVANTGKMGKNGYLQSPGEHNWGGLQYYDDCDTTDNGNMGNDDVARYLYEASPFILRINDTQDTLLSTAIFDADWLDKDGLRPLERLTVDSSSGDYHYAYTGKILTRDSAIALEAELWAPTDFGDCEFMVHRLRVYPNTDEAFDAVFIGMLSDWDVPSDSGFENGSDWDASRQMMYVYGAEYGSDLIVNNDCILADDRLGGVAYYGGYRKPHCMADAYNVDSFPDVRGMWTHMNADWVIPTGGFVGGQLYRKMATFGGYESWQSTNPGLEDSLYQDLHLVTVFGQFDLGETDTLVFVTILSTSRYGLSDLQSSIDNARDWISAHGLFVWPPLENCQENCCLDHGVPGDANGDGAVNLLDILHVLEFVYGSYPGSHHNPYDCDALLDANGDGVTVDDPAINISDISTLIRHVYCDPYGEPELCCPPGCVTPVKSNGEEVRK
ncbi:MAG: dockerin type I repeat-containing protein [candidate division Zixibacteria bacterium]|nr:dockerin type I repeat-containing protein [candidate division Zixibacteria bacterium]